MHTYVFLNPNLTFFFYFMCRISQPQIVHDACKDVSSTLISINCIKKEDIGNLISTEMMKSLRSRRGIII